MIQVTVITVGNLKEAYWRDAISEYEKRLGAFCKPEIIQLKEAHLSDNPSASEIGAALADEGKRILAAIPPRSYKI
ncbi:MAG: 23S rRNA (pseudouridine(1915)-N(3))-methyltransferase RlmH, partial [Clostridia bacterium]|nr:23S rRNA (pseudouridine(1915)-N(3))-methyltransferase RlmH [Clostridia bacterium]